MPYVICRPAKLRQYKEVLKITLLQKRITPGFNGDGDSTFGLLVSIIEIRITSNIKQYQNGEVNTVIHLRFYVHGNEPYNRQPRFHVCFVLLVKRSNVRDRFSQVATASSARRQSGGVEKLYLFLFFMTKSTWL